MSSTNTPEHPEGAAFLHKQNSLLQQSAEVNHTINRTKLAVNNTVAQIETKELPSKPREKIDSWMHVLEQTHLSHSDDPKVMGRIKKVYHKRYVIQQHDIPESAYLLEQRIARNMGYGDIEITDQFRDKKAAEIIANQEATLDQWIDYLTGTDAMYPMWAKYWAFTSMVKLGKLEKVIVKDENGEEHEEVKFKKRKKDTVAPFPTLNPRALALTIGAVQEHVEQKYGTKKTSRLANESKQLDQAEYERLIKGTHFGQIYAQFLKELPQYSAEGLKETRGEWVKFPQHSDPTPLVESLMGHPLEWCTANKDTARTQLEGGDFYVYYSYNNEGEATIPRLAIRMSGNSIAEVRGIAADQNLDPYISPVLTEKMKEFPDGEEYQLQSADMQRLTQIEIRQGIGEELTLEELRFLYEQERTVTGFGYNKDPRIAEIRSDRNPLEDAQSLCDGYSSGDLNLDWLENAMGLVLPTSVEGDLRLHNMTSAEGLILPQSVGGELHLDGLTSAEGLILPQSVGGSLHLSNLTSAEGLTLPQSVGWDLDLDNITSAEGLILPQSVGGTLALSGLTSAEGLILPQSVGGNLALSGLTSAEGLILPQSVGGYLVLRSLTSAEGLTLPQSVGGHLYLSGLTSAEGLTLPQSVGGDLILSGLTSAEGLTLPQSVRGTLDLRSLTSAEGLTLPQSVRGTLDLRSLTSAEGLTLPQSVGGELHLDGITSAEGLTLPESVGRVIFA